MMGASARNGMANVGPRGGDKQQEKLREQDEGQGVVRDERGQEQPADKSRAQQNNRTQRNTGLRTQKEAAEDEDNVPSPGEPARGE